MVTVQVVPSAETESQFPQVTSAGLPWNVDSLRVMVVPPAKLSVQGPASEPSGAPTQLMCPGEPVTLSDSGGLARTEGSAPMASRCAADRIRSLRVELLEPRGQDESLDASPTAPDGVAPRVPH